MRILVVPLCLLSAACGSGGGTATTANALSASQVVARVNGNELTLSQLNQALTDKDVTAVDSDSTKQVLEDLINEELLVEQAQTAKLDRDPDVLLRIEQAKRQILADAYESRSVYPQANISEAAMHAYYEQNPTLFKNRRIYRMTAFATNKATLPATVMHDLGATRSVDAMRELLNRNGVTFSLEELNQGADEVALELVPKLAAAQVGDVVATTYGSGKLAALLLIQDIKTSPLPYEQVSATIENYLATQRNTTTLAAYLQRLRKGARIEYVGTVGKTATTTDAEHAAEGLKNLN